MPDGGVMSPAALVRCSVDGNRKLNTTAVKAAEKVPSRYRNRMGRMLVFCPCWWLAIDAMTSIRTSTGATAFSAPTKRVPSSPVASAAGFDTIASRIPSTSPTRICLTRLPCARRANSPLDCVLIRIS